MVRLALVCVTVAILVATVTLAGARSTEDKPNVLVTTDRSEARKFMRECKGVLSDTGDRNNYIMECEDND